MNVSYPYLKVWNAADFVSHLAAIFKKAEHTTIHRYLVDLRLRRAASLLWGCDDLTTLALNLGFASQSHFSNAFRRWAGCPPGQYRTRLRAFGVLYGKNEESFG